MSTRSSLDRASLAVLIGQVADEFTERLNRGEQPRIAEYAERHPEIAEVLQEVLGALQWIRDSAPSLALTVLPESESPEGQGTLGDYRIIREIGRGGMGIVYEAQQISLGRRVALKVLPFASTLDARQLQRFKNEAQAAAHLHDTHIVPVFATGCERGVHYYAMQYIEGRTLAQVIQDARGEGARARVTGIRDRESGVGNRPSVHPSTLGPQPSTARAGRSSTERPADKHWFRTIAQWGIQAAEALEHAHQVGVIHRDIKPANLLIDVRGDLWITDFGLASCHGGTGLTMTGDLLGTLRYMSPEQALGQRATVDHRTDVYSLGATLYELLTLEPAFPGEDRQELLRRIVSDDPVSLRKRNSSIPAELETIVLKTLAKSRDERYEAAQELADDLRRMLDDEPIRARRPSLPQIVGKWARRHKYVVRSAVGVLAAAAVALALSTYLIWQKEAEVRRAYLSESTQRKQATAAFAAERSAKQAEAKQRARAEASEQQAKDRLTEVERQRKAVSQNLYYSDMRLGLADWNGGNVARLSSKLLSHLPRSGGEDLRAWEWYYLLALCHEEDPTLMDYSNTVTSVAWSPNGQYLAATGYSGNVRIYDSGSWRLLQTWSGSSARGVSWSLDGSRIAWGGTDAGTYVGHIETKEVQRLHGHTSSVWTTAWSPDGKYLASAGMDQTIRVWEPGNGSCMRVLEGIRNHIDSIVWHPRGKLLASLGVDDGLKLWDTDAGRVIKADPNVGTHGHLAWSPDGGRLAVGGVEACRVLNAEDLSLASQWDAPINWIAWSPDGSRIASAGVDHLIKVWDPTTGSCLLTERGHVNQVLSVDWEPDGKRLASGGLDGLIKVWSLSRASRPRHLDGRSTGVLDVAWDADGDTLWSLGYEDGVVAHWNVLDGHCLAQATVSRGRCARLSSAGELVAIAADDQPRIFIHDGRSGEPVQVLDDVTVHGEFSSKAAFSPDASKLAISSGGTTTEAVDVRRNKVIGRWEGIEVDSLSWSPGGRLLAITGNFARKGGGWAFVVDSETSQRVMQVGDDVVTTAAGWSPDGTRLASGDMNGLASVWEVPSGRRLARAPLHTARIRSLAWSPDGKRVASASDDNTVRIWDPTCGEELLRFDAPSSWMTQLRWSPNGRRLAISAKDGRILIVDASPGYEYLQRPEHCFEVACLRLDEAAQFWDAGDREKAIAHCEQALKDIATGSIAFPGRVWGRVFLLAETGRDQGAHRDVFRLLRLFVRLDDTNPNALSLFTRSVDWMERNNPKHEEFQRFRRETELLSRVVP